MQAGNFKACVHPQRGVEVRQRLVKQEYLGLAHDGAANGNPLALATGQGLRRTGQIFGDMQHVGGGAHTAVDFVRRQLALFQPESHVVVDGHMRVEGIGLEHHGHATLRRRNVIHPHIADIDIPAGDFLEPGDHPQQRGLAATGRADEHHEFAIVNGEIDIVNDAHITI